MVLGSKFITDVALFRLRVTSPVQLMPGVLGTDVALRTVCEALSAAACDELGLEPTELRAEYRPALTKRGADGSEVEIFLYDTLPGGAGFSRRAAALGNRLFLKAEELLATCLEDCDSSCYRCLRSFRNRFEHTLLDRHVGLSLLRYLVRGDLPVLSASRIKRAYGALYDDLKQQYPSLVIERDAQVTLPGVGPVRAPLLVVEKSGRRVIVSLKRPLTADAPLEPSLQDAMDFQAEVPIVTVDELVVTRNLPTASLTVVRAAKGEA